MFYLFFIMLIKIFWILDIINIPQMKIFDDIIPLNTLFWLLFWLLVPAISNTKDEDEDN